MSRCAGHMSLVSSESSAPRFHVPIAPRREDLAHFPGGAQEFRPKSYRDEVKSIHSSRTDMLVFHPSQFGPRNRVQDSPIPADARRIMPLTKHPIRFVCCTYSKDAGRASKGPECGPGLSSRRTVKSEGRTTMTKSVRLLLIGRL